MKSCGIAALFTLPGCVGAMQLGSSSNLTYETLMRSSGWGDCVAVDGDGAGKYWEGCDGAPGHSGEYNVGSQSSAEACYDAQAINANCGGVYFYYGSGDGSCYCMKPVVTYCHPVCVAGTPPDCTDQDMLYQGPDWTSYDCSGNYYTAATTTTLDVASAQGDPHLQNIFGERFDLMKPGKVALISIPRGERSENRLLIVEADAQRLGGHCADMFFQTVSITGPWADKVQTGGFSFTAQSAHGEMGQMLNWTNFGPLKLKVSRGRTDKGIYYLNFYVKHLRHAGFAVGGLLGEDDHVEAATSTGDCQKKVFLSAKVSPTGQSSFASVGMAISE